VAGDRVQALGRDAILHLHALHHRTGIQVRAGVEDLARLVEEHASLALRRGDHAANAAVGRQARERSARAPAEHVPESDRIEVEAADQREIGIREEMVRERLLRGSDDASRSVHDDAASRAGPSVERDEEVAGHAQARRSSTAGFAIQRGRSPRSQRSIASTTISL
jgi:hypothetical protein